MLDVRGWGYLTGQGQALALSADSAIAAQEATAEWVVSALNAAWARDQSPQHDTLAACPATEPHGYAITADWSAKMLPLDEDVAPRAGCLAVRPSDTRVVTTAQLIRWIELADLGSVATPINEIRAIIGTATPAPSDKIADAARDCRPENYASGVQCQTCGQSWGEDGPEQCPNAALLALDTP